MSQSPIDDFSPSATLRYQQGWKALNRLLHEDRSFSGHERNCVFLNIKASTTRGRFADVSAASGLDFDDDARAIAVADWDLDGDLDLWITNRTAPRVRLMRNNSNDKHHFLAIKLIGDGIQTNRDAIGARVELRMAGSEGRKQVKSLHCGDGFLSQSSNWIHFGLADETDIESLIVKWPGGGSRTFQGLKADKRYLIHQATNRASLWRPPLDRKPLEASEPELPELNEQARIILPGKMLLPKLKIAGSKEYLNSLFKGPTLINLWTTTCRPCLEELSEWSNSAERIRSAGLDIIAVNLDETEGETLEAETILKRLNFPFRSYQGTKHLVQSLDIFQRSLLDRWQPLPVPLSVLVDRQGQAVAIYKGRVALERLIEDVGLLELSRGKLRHHASPFSGRWITDPPESDPLRVTSQFIDHAMIDEGLEYLQRYVQNLSQNTQQTQPESLGDYFYVLAVLLNEQNQSEAATATYRKVIEFNPDDFRARNDLATLLAKQGDLSAAADELTEASRIKPGDISVIRKLAFVRMKSREFAEAVLLFERIVQSQQKDVASWYNLANAYRNLGDYLQANRCYRQTLTIAPRMTLAANNLAWILATHQDETIRNGNEAVKLAELICKETNYQRPDFLDTLAVAYAEQGNYNMAVQSAQKAIDRFTSNGTPEKATIVQKRLELYKAEKPYREALIESKP